MSEIISGVASGGMKPRLNTPRWPVCRTPATASRKPGGSVHPETQAQRRSLKIDSHQTGQRGSDRREAETNPRQRVRAGQDEGGLFADDDRAGRAGLFFGFRFRSLLLRLVRFLNGANILAP